MGEYFLVLVFAADVFGFAVDFASVLGTDFFVMVATGFIESVFLFVAFVILVEVVTDGAAGVFVEFEVVEMGIVVIGTAAAGFVSVAVFFSMRELSVV